MSKIQQSQSVTPLTQPHLKEKKHTSRNIALITTAGLIGSAAKITKSITDPITISAYKENNGSAIIKQNKLDPSIKDSEELTALAKIEYNALNLTEKLKLKFEAIQNKQIRNKFLSNLKPKSYITNGLKGLAAGAGISAAIIGIAQLIKDHKKKQTE